MEREIRLCRTFATLGGIFHLVSAFLAWMLNFLLYAILYGAVVTLEGGLYSLVASLPTITIGIIMLCNKPSALITIPISFSILFSVKSIYRAIIDLVQLDSILHSFFILSELAINILLIICCCRVNSKRTPNALKGIWFVPIIIVGILQSINLINNSYYFLWEISIHSTVQLLYIFMVIANIFFFAYWLRLHNKIVSGYYVPYMPEPQYYAPEPQYYVPEQYQPQTYEPQPIVEEPIPQAEEAIQEPVSDNFDKIKKYKELLDSGIISEEEFEKKKRELLNL